MSYYPDPYLILECRNNKTENVSQRPDIFILYYRSRLSFMPPSLIANLCFGWWHFNGLI